MESTLYPHVALLVDSTTISINKPISTFSEAKVFWDGKNHTYGIKKEVAVSASKPHYAVFVQVVCTIMKFWRKGPRGTSNILSRPQKRSKNFHKITSLAGQLCSTMATKDHSLILQDFVVRCSSCNFNCKSRIGSSGTCKLRVLVEQFFGRMTQLWAITKNKYRWSHELFDTDIDNCVWLTNENIRFSQLLHLDYQFHIAYIKSRIHQEMAAFEKRRVKQRVYAEKKKLRLSASFD